MSTITIKNVSITELDTDCVVNAANDGLRPGSGVCGAIFEAAGAKELQAACDEIGGCPTGHAVVTPGFGLKAKYIIHAVGPIWQGGSNGEPQQLYSCYYEALERARENGCHSIGFPLISTGVFGYPKEPAWRMALEACRHFRDKNKGYDIDIVFAVPDPKVAKLGEEILCEMGLREEAEPRLNLIGFHQPELPNGYLSNWYIAKFKVGGVTFSSIEQYMMYMKAEVFGDRKHAAEIMTLRDAQEIKRVGREVENYDDRVWNGLRQVIVYEGLLAKFCQNSDLGEKLRNTGDAVIAECAAEDPVWGIGMSLQDEDRFYMSRWKGTNYLGFSLMFVRNRLQNRHPDGLDEPE